MRNELPVPGEDAQAHAQALARRIADVIEAEGGWISFARFMELALYTPGLGYYSGGARKFGPEGDFVTAPEISPLFGHALAAQVAQVLACSAAHVIEVGAGTGLLACDLLDALAARDALPEHYDILELSGELRVRQQETLQARVPQYLDRVRWLDALPARFSGCVVANEVLDVMPVQRLVWRAEGIFERGVVMDPEAGGFGWQDRPASGRLLSTAQALPVEGCEASEYLSEVCLAAAAWVGEWAGRLEKGGLLLIDYGYPCAEYYLPARSTGTLQCYYRHRAHTDLLAWPGLNDITAFVDFTAVAEAADAAGLAVCGFTNQATFLTNCGLLEALAAVGPTDEAPYIRASRAALRLIAPHEMGELFKVILLGKGLDEPMLGFTRGDRTHTL